MKKLTKKYLKAKIKIKKIKITYFLTPVGFLDQFNLLGTVYAQSGGEGEGGEGQDACCSTCSPGA